MKIILVSSQLAIAATLINVWVFRYRQMIEEFQYYQLPNWLRDFTCVSKLLLAIGLIVGVWVPSLTIFSAQLLALYMLCALVAHVRVRNPILKAVPALAVLSLCILLISAGIETI